MQRIAHCAFFFWHYLEDRDEGGNHGNSRKQLKLSLFSSDLYSQKTPGSALAMRTYSPKNTHTDKCTQTHSTKNGVHLYAVADVVGHSDQQGLLDDRIQQGQEDLCSYLQQRRGRLSLV